VNGKPFAGVLASVLGVNKFVAWRGVSPTQQHGEDVADLAVQDTVAQALLGATGETAPASDTAAAGLNGRLQRIAQRLTSLIGLLPASIGQKARAAALAVTLSTEDITLFTSLQAHLNTLQGAIASGRMKTTPPAITSIGVHRITGAYAAADAAITLVNTTLPTRIPYFVWFTDTENYMRLTIRERRSGVQHFLYPMEKTGAASSTTQWYPDRVRDLSPQLFELIEDTTTGSTGGQGSGSYGLKYIGPEEFPEGVEIIFDNTSGSTSFQLGYTLMGYTEG
jgi:hypothetical protein